MARELHLRIQQLGNPWEPPSDDDLQLLSDMAQLIRSASPDVVTDVPLLEMLHKIFLSIWLLDMPLRNAAGGSTSRDAAEDAGCPLLEAAAPLLKALADSDSVICSQSRSAFVRLLDKALPHPVLDGIQCRKQVCPSRASCLAKAVESLRSSLRLQLRDNVHQSPLTCQRLPALQYLLPAQIAMRVSRVLRAPSASEFEACLQQLLLQFDEAAPSPGSGTCIQTGMYTMALMAVQEEMERPSSSTDNITDNSSPWARNIKWNAAELSEVLLDIVLDAERQQQQLQQSLEQPHDSSGSWGSVGMRLAAVFIPSLLSNAATCSSTSVEAAVWPPGHREADMAPWGPCEHLALWALDRFTQAATLRSAPVILQNQGGGYHEEEASHMDIICFGILRQAASGPYRAVLDQAMKHAGGLLRALGCKRGGGERPMDSGGKLKFPCQGRNSMESIMRECLESDLRYWPALSSWLDPICASSFFRRFALDQLKRHQHQLRSTPKASQHYRDEIPQKHLLAFMLWQQMEQEQAMLLHGGCWRCQSEAAEAPAAGATAMNDLSKPCGCEASGEKMVLLLCSSRDAALALFPDPCFPDSYRGAPLSELDHAAEEVCVQRTLCLGLLMRTWARRLSILAVEEGVAGSASDSVVPKWLGHLQVVLERAARLLQKLERKIPGASVKGYLSRQCCVLQAAMAQVADYVNWGAPVQVELVTRPVAGGAPAEQEKAGCPPGAAKLPGKPPNEVLKFGDVGRSIIPNLGMWAAVFCPRREDTLDHCWDQGCEQHLHDDDKLETGRRGNALLGNDGLVRTAAALFTDGGVVFTLPLLGIAAALSRSGSVDAESSGSLREPPGELRGAEAAIAPPAVREALLQLWNVVVRRHTPSGTADAEIQRRQGFRHDAVEGWLRLAGCLLPFWIGNGSACSNPAAVLEEVSCFLDGLMADTALHKEAESVAPEVQQHLHSATRALCWDLLGAPLSPSSQERRGTLLTDSSRRSCGPAMALSVARRLTHSDIFRSASLVPPLNDRAGEDGKGGLFHGAPGVFFSCDRELSSVWMDDSVEMFADYAAAAIGAASMPSSPLAGFLGPSWVCFNRALVAMTGMKPCARALVCTSVAAKTCCPSDYIMDDKGGFADGGSRGCAPAEISDKIRCAFARLAMTAALTRARAALDALHQLLLAVKQQQQPQKQCPPSTLEESDHFQGEDAAAAGNCQAEFLDFDEQISIFAAIMLLPGSDPEGDGEEEAELRQLKEALEARELLEGLRPLLGKILPPSSSGGSSSLPSTSPAGQWLSLQLGGRGPAPAARGRPRTSTPDDLCQLVQVSRLRVAIIFPEDFGFESERRQVPDVSLLCLLMVSGNSSTRTRAASYTSRMICSGSVAVDLCQAAASVIGRHWTLCSHWLHGPSDGAVSREFVAVVESAVAAAPYRPCLGAAHRALLKLAEALDCAAARLLLQAERLGNLAGADSPAPHTLDGETSACHRPADEKILGGLPAAATEILWGVSRLAAALSRVCPQAVAGRHNVAELLNASVAFAGYSGEEEPGTADEHRRRELILSSLAGLGGFGKWDPSGVHRDEFISGTLQRVLSSGSEFAWQSSILHAEQCTAGGGALHTGSLMQQRLDNPLAAECGLLRREGGRRVKSNSCDASGHGGTSRSAEGEDSALRCYVARTRRLMELKTSAQG